MNKHAKQQMPMQRQEVVPPKPLEQRELLASAVPAPPPPLDPVERAKLVHTAALAYEPVDTMPLRPAPIVDQPRMPVQPAPVAAPPDTRSWPRLPLYRLMASFEGSWGPQFLRLAKGKIISEESYGPGVIARLREMGAQLEEVPRP